MRHAPETTRPAGHEERSGREDDSDLVLLTDRYVHRVGFFVRQVSRRFFLADAWHDDLVSAGNWGLLKALRNRRLDAHEREVSSYVSQRIEGAVIDEARGLLRRWGRQSVLDPVAWEIRPEAVASEVAGESAWRGEDPEQQLERQTLWRHVERALAALDPAERALLLGYAEGHSISELARSERASAGVLRSRMNRATRQIRARDPALRRVLRGEW